MNGFAADRLRPVLAAHHALAGDPLLIRNRSHCVIGTKPVCEHPLTPLDLFHFLEITRNKRDLEHVLPWFAPDETTYEYDFSSVVATGSAPTPSTRCPQSWPSRGRPARPPG